MRNKLCFLALIFVLSLGLTLAWVFAAQASVPTAELHVCPSGCTYDNVQDAVDAASEGDVIKVAEGTYTGVSARDGVTQTVYLSKTLTIEGGYTTSDVTIRPRQRELVRRARARRRRQRERRGRDSSRISGLCVERHADSGP